MRIAVFGLGYVGTVAAACLARDNHEVIGVDPNPTKVSLINDGKSPIIEKDIDELIAKAVSTGRLRAIDDPVQAVHQSDLSLVCVGTPSRSNGSLDTGYVEKVCREIGTALRSMEGKKRHTVVIRSTLLPGSMRNIVIPALQQTSSLEPGTDFGLCNNPEFLREGSAVYDYDNPPKTVIGEIDRASGDKLMLLYAHLDAPEIRTSVDEAEMVKYVDNVWHALKICFANEIGNIAKSADLDGTRIMEIFCQDTKLNISSAYLKPGFAFGGSCLPKDVRALTHFARTSDMRVPVLDSLLDSNSSQVDNAFNMITSEKVRRIGVLGFSFKAGTDDLRESPVVELIERLIGKGYELRLYDRNVQIAALVGANKDYILNHIPHIARLMTDSIDDLLQFADTVVIGNNDPAFLAALTEQDVKARVIDLSGIGRDLADSNPNYVGICW